ncbi:FAD-dependent oxidoreductase [Nocardioides piscis]|uniref:NAD(P)/FAD-dependent oxidoreductase n=1 Tax=Nocardioides piscis TaxID=2714938 RepID=A0A6G7YCG3_9ACTN|nr:FAD/NAD(P)-binding oxidoreductase [Nocardioides piscis]QIK74341.1 NAD(P)/FAD-dependent oxidoreductase [Nocardioides piscis]
MEQHEILIVGGGNAGISLAARLLRDGAHDVAVVESEPVHRYRPLLNYVGVGEATMGSLEKPAADVVPEGCTAIADRVVAVDVSGPRVLTAEGRRIQATTLVLCPGLEEDWDDTPGLVESQAAGWGGSTFVVESAPRVWPALRDLQQGRVVFTVPPEPAPCAATALKPLFMACDHWRRSGVLERIEVWLALPTATPLGIPRADELVEEALRSYGVNVIREARVVGLGDRTIRLATPGGERELDELSFAHVVPHYRAPGWIADSDLAGDTPGGLVDVDPLTLRHRRFPAIWSLGDVADVATRPSGGALRKQVDVLAHNLRAADDASMQHYDGYTVMPITLSRRRLMLVEVDREGRSQPSVPFPDLVRPRWSTWRVDRYVLPWVYFRRILRGKV